MRAGKHVFVEKPLCLSLEELEKIEAAQAESGCRVMVGFNRRFSPHTVAIQKALRSRQRPMAMVMTVNAGSVPSDHWTRDVKIGGGRIVGEACHFVDLLYLLSGSPIVAHSISRLGEAESDGATIQLEFVDGSTGTIHYLTNGHRSFPKERLEVFVEGKVFAIDNFRRTRAIGAGEFRTVRTFRQNKGHSECVKEFVKSIRYAGVEDCIHFAGIVEVTRTVLALDASGDNSEPEPHVRRTDVPAVDGGSDIGLSS